MAKQTKSNSLTVVHLPAELLKITESSGMAITEAQSIGFKFAPFMQKVNEISMQIAAIEQTNPTPEDAALARKLRLSLVENRGTKGLATVHKDLKAESLVRGRLIDSFRNVVDQSSEMSELIAERIEKHSERMEAERQLTLSNERKELLLPYGTDTTYLPLGKITDEQFEKILANEKLLFNAKKAELERLEAERLENERVAEANRIEAERLAAEKRALELKEQERVKKELAAKELLLHKEREAAKVLADKVAKENAAKLAEQQRLAEIERKKQADILAKQQEIARKAQAELQEKRDAEAKLLAEKKRAELAPDKEKINQLYLSIQNFKIPDFKSVEAQHIGGMVIKELAAICTLIKLEAQKLK